MKTTVEKLSPTRAKLTIAVTPDELKPSITHAYEHIAAEVTIPGFRKGKVPPAIIDSRVGKAAVLDHAINDGLGDIYTQAVNEEKLSPLGQPAVDVVTVPDLKDFSGDLEVTFEVDVRPDITIPAYDGIAVTVDAADITPDDVENELDRLRSRFGTLVTVDRPAQAGDFAQLSLSADIAGNIVDTADNISYEVGSGDLIEGIDEALDGLSAGETTTFKSTLLGGDHEGEDAEITITLSAVKVRELPEADDDFAQIASEFDTIGELRESLRGEAARGKAFVQNDEARGKLVDALLEKVDIPLPDAIVEDEVHRHLEAENRLEDDVHRAEVTESSQKTLRTQILFDEIARELGVKVDNDELTQYVVQAAAQYGMDPNEFAQLMSQNGQIPQLVGEVARNKAISIVLGRAKVTDTNGKPVDLSEFTAVLEEEPTEDEAAAAADAKKPAAKKPAAGKTPAKKAAAKAADAE